MERNALMGPFQQGYAGQVVERGNIIPAGTYEDGVTRWAWPGIIDAPWEAWKRFALSGGQDVKAGAEVATNALMGGMASPKPVNALGTFGGRLAKTADHAALARAEDMIARGVPREQVWADTGWFRGVDGKWRFEIDDSGARLGDGATIGAALQHDGLKAAYPDVSAYEFEVADLGRKQFGLFSPSDAISGLPPSIRVSQSGQRGLSSLLHEMQHGIQRDETFATGANQFGMSPAAIEIYRGLIKKMKTKMSLAEWAASQFDGDVDAARASYKDYLKTAGKITPQLDRTAQETAVELAYRRSAGEVEARTVQKRMDMTPEQRRARPPWEDYDVPEDQQIVRFR